MISNEQLRAAFLTPAMKHYFERKLADLSSAEAAARIEELLKYLNMTAHSHGSIPVNDEIDYVWHLCVTVIRRCVRRPRAASSFTTPPTTTRNTPTGGQGAPGRSATCHGDPAFPCRELRASGRPGEVLAGRRAGIQQLAGRWAQRLAPRRNGSEEPAIDHQPVPSRRNESRQVPRDYLRAGRHAARRAADARRRPVRRRPSLAFRRSPRSPAGRTSARNTSSATWRQRAGS
jgi:hypothetical protein